jgi:DNA-binding IclR family transcriptional regulator
VPTAKSTTHRYVVTLLSLGVLARNEAGRLRLGVKLVELAGALLDGDQLRSAAEPVLHDLVARTGETVHLGVPTDDGVVYVAKVESPQSVRLVSRIGARVALHCSAMGKAVMARLDEPALQAALARPRDVRTIHTITSAEALLAELEKVREAGVAIDDEENELGVRCVGTVIVGARGESIGAISVSAPATRMTHERCAEFTPVVIAAAREIARRLGRPAANPNQTR